MISESHYKQSVKSNLACALITFSFSVLLVIIFGYLYNILTIIIRFIYLNLFICLGYRAILGYTVKFSSRLRKIRNQDHSILIAFGTGLIGFYFQWITYFEFFNIGDHSFQALQGGFLFNK